jgi:cob(I)alamin adenosyltransferase
VGSDPRHGRDGRQGTDPPARERSLKIYTRTGDKGETSLYGGARVAKNDLRIDAYGTVDELNSFIGLARATSPSSPLDADLDAIQGDLFHLGARLAAPGVDLFAGIVPARIEFLEHAIDTMEKELRPLKNFILPGGSVAAAHLHVARTICRRAERLLVAISEDVTYLNRLADYLFVAARFANAQQGVPDVPWVTR